MFSGERRPGFYSFGSPKPGMRDFGYVVYGEATIRRPGRPDVELKANSVVLFPGEPIELIIHKDFLKHSTFFDPAGLEVELEPLPST